uniref:NADH dehydrogenase subunit 6 n=1 Tax=Pallenopsis patagonica TaxID=648475 RepID=UPI00226D2040|nr:NADH dehydrogenase subunit 6 [Pallenopsis patagonica]UZA61348.1 NADH dehydrogenase subunit 6 [Pallenopsis patagonica]
MKLMYISTLYLMMLFSLAKSPLMMVFLILIQTIILSLMINLLHNLFWMSYILILIFLGGMLVIFIYIASLTSNEKMKWSINKNTFLIKMTMLILIWLFMMNQNEIMTSHNWNNMSNISKPIMAMNKMYMNNMMMNTLFLATFLMITLFIIVKISNLNKGPLRKK